MFLDPKTKKAGKTEAVFSAFPGSFLNVYVYVLRESVNAPQQFRRRDFVQNCIDFRPDVVHRLHPLL